MISQEVLEAQPRPAESRGKNEARRLRASGRVPAVVYGAKKDAVAVSVDPKHISKILRSASGHNTIFDLQVGAEKTKAMIVDWQYEPLKGKLLHIDMNRIAMDEKIRVKIPIHLVGEAAGVKTQGGIMDQVLREVEVECLPADIPEHITIDVSDLEIGSNVRVSDLPVNPKIKILSDSDLVVAHVISPKEEKEPEPTVEAVVAEPEVIKKGKVAEGDEGEEGKAEEKKDKK